MNTKAIIVHIRFPYTSESYLRNSLGEMQQLLKTLDIEVVNTFIQSRREPDPKYFIGKGKLEEIKASLLTSGKVDLLIFNNEISPLQARNLERETRLKVLTRTEVILEIFWRHAKTETAKLQVELAKLRYLLPRIIGKGVELSRLGGGVGTRGPGEQKLEMERREIKRRIDLLKKRLSIIEKQKSIQRKKRLENSFKIAIAGYTNAGKSSLLKRLTKANVLIEDKLFATLDTTTRKLWLGNSDIKLDVVITDTVGFIRDIPHFLIESFKSTIIDTVKSDIIIHLVDASEVDFSEKISVVENILKELGVPLDKVLLCFNKIDLLSPVEIERLKSRYKDAIFISTTENKGIEELKQKILEFIQKGSYFLDKTREREFSTSLQ